MSPEHRFYLPPEQCHENGLALTGPEAHHALDVLRVRAGETVSVLDGAGQQFVCRVSRAARGRVDLETVEKQEHPPRLAAVTLLQAVPKGKMMETIIQKATELGVARIVPLLTTRVVTQLDEEEAVSKGEKWQAVAVEAIKQSGNPWLPKVENPARFKTELGRLEKAELALVASLRESSAHMRARFDASRAALGRLPKSVSLWVGPEGDFTVEELDAIEASGAKPITLGSLVLRCETAAIYCLSVINHELSTGDATKP